MTGVHRRIADHVYERLREQIVTGALVAGDRIDPTDVAAELGISRTPVREAVLRLDAEGLVTRQPYRGVVVSGVDVAAAAEVAATRIHLECLATRVAVPRLQPADLAAMRRLNEELVAGLTGADAQESFRTLNRDLHMTLYRAAGSPVLLRLIEDLAGQAERIRLHVDVRRGHAADEHAAILAACEDGDVEAAVAATREHILSAYRSVVPAGGPVVDEGLLTAVLAGARPLG